MEDSIHRPLAMFSLAVALWKNKRVDEIGERKQNDTRLMHPYTHDERASPSPKVSIGAVRVFTSISEIHDKVICELSRLRSR